MLTDDEISDIIFAHLRKDSRKAFELWAKSQKYGLERSKNAADQAAGYDYLWNDTEHAWTGWKAAHKGAIS